MQEQQQLTVEWIMRQGGVGWGDADDHMHKESDVKVVSMALALTC